jgi:hypothetical protein
MDGKTLVTLEGQQHWIDAAIAQDDNLLRQLFSTLSPALAGAEIHRTSAGVNLIPKKGIKGTNPLSILDGESKTIHPGIECCLALQQLELKVGINPAHAAAIAAQIEGAIAQTDAWKKHIQTTLKRLDQATNQSLIPLGF